MHRFAITATFAVVFALGVFALGAPRAHAEPMFTDADTLLKKSEIVVVATVERPKKGVVALRIHRVLRDRPKRATQPTLTVGVMDYDMLGPDGTLAVFFLDAQGAPLYQAAPPKHAKVTPETLGEHPLELTGFYAFNAHLIEPAVASLTSIERALKTGVIQDTITVTVAYPGPSGLTPDPTHTYTFTVRNGKHATSPKPNSAQLGISTWNHDIALVLPGPHPTTLKGTLTRAQGDRLTGHVVPAHPVLNTPQALQRWRTSGVMRLPIEVQLGAKRATLTVTGDLQGALGPGLGLQGKLAAVRRINANGHTQRTGPLAHDTEPPHHGWNIELHTPQGPLWLTVPIAQIEARTLPGLAEIDALQLHVALALARGPLDVQAHGALTGTGTLRLASPAKKTPAPAR